MADENEIKEAKEQNQQIGIKRTATHLPNNLQHDVTLRQLNSTDVNPNDTILTAVSDNDTQYETDAGGHEPIEPSMGNLT